MSRLAYTAAEQLRASLGKTKKPIDPKKIAQKLKIKVVEESDFDNGLAGLLVTKKGKPVIFVNTNDSEPRKRFTIAHEIGHFILHQQEGRIEDAIIDSVTELAARDEKSSSGTDAREIEANRFAAELLMPRELLIKEKGPMSDERVGELAEEYKVSSTAMTYRLQTLGLL